MQLVLHLNARFQPKHRFELEDALQEIFQENNAGEITGGGTSLKENGEIDSCDINYAIEQLEQTIEGIGCMYSYRELNEFTALYFYGTSFLTMKEKMNPFISSYPLCQKCMIEQIA